MTLSRTLNSVNVTKSNLLEVLPDPDDLVCPHYVINRLYSAFVETVFIAEMSSMFWGMSDQDTYRVYLGFVPKGRRYNKIVYKKPPPPPDEVMEACRAYNISVEKYNDIKHLLERES